MYFNIAQKYRNILLLAVSYCFYMAWKWEFALLMLFVTLVNYIFGLKISQNTGRKKTYLALAVTLTILPLVYFKYANFFIDNFIDLFNYIGFNTSKPLLNVILPVGISFFTFQALSYSLDIYNNKTKVERNFVNFAVFVAFFPQLVAGPIERSSNLLSQFRNKYNFDSNLFLDGAKLFIWGLFKKVVIADRLAIYVDRIYENPDLYSGSTSVVATLFFTIQIYCDFSGYSDMAIGSARILGFKLMQNFNLPYLANSISDFWRRWHISLSSWFGDYLYKPLGGNRVPYFRWVINIYIVFLVSGFWHGANWTFIVWGGLHATYYLIERFGDQLLVKLSFERIKKTSLYKWFKIVIVFILVAFAWIYFRANSFDDAVLISKNILTFKTGDLYRGASNVTFLMSCVLIVLLVIVQLLQYNKIMSIYFSKSRLPATIQFVWYLFLLLGISLFGVSSKSFIYFQF